MPATTETMLRMCKAKRERALKSQRGTWCIDGEYVTRHQIAERLGIAVQRVPYVMGKAKKLDGAVSWDKLKGLV